MKYDSSGNCISLWRKRAWEPGLMVTQLSHPAGPAETPKGTDQQNTEHKAKLPRKPEVR